MQLLEHLNTKLASQSCGQEEHLVISIFCLILHQSTNQVLKEASKVILLSNSLVTAAGSLIQTACAKGPALVDYDEETTLGESLIFVLLLYIFSLKRSVTLYLSLKLTAANPSNDIFSQLACYFTGIHRLAGFPSVIQ